MRNHRGSALWVVAALAAAWAMGADGEGRAQDAFASRLQTSRESERVTFSEHVAPIIFANCSPCHRPDGAASFSLLGYADVRPRGRLIAIVTRSRSMPPWKPEPGRGDFQGVRRLSEEQIALIQRWVEGGMPQGDPARLPPAPKWTSAWQAGAPDLVLQLPEAYSLRATGTDVHRQFVVRVPVSERRFIKAWEFRPGNSRVVHHATLYLDPTDLAQRLDDEDPEPGYEGLLPHSARNPDGYLLEWTPGHEPYVAPAGMSFPLEANSHIVMSLHLRPSGQPEQVQPSVGLYFADRPPARTPVTLRLSAQDMDIPANEPSYVVTRSYTLPIDIDVLTTQPHAHFLAREVEGIAALPDGTKKWLLHIRDWDFDWQDTYRYASPVFLPAGTTISMRWRFDNSAANRRNPHSPPRRMTYGQLSADEMAELWFQVLPRRESDRPLLTTELRRRALPEEIVGHELMLREHPDRVSLHDDLALLHAELGNFQQVAAHFAESVRLKPQSAAAHYNLGAALLSTGERARARAHFETALTLDPDYSNAHRGLGVALQREGRVDQAASHYRDAVRLSPNDLLAHHNLGVLLHSQGKIDEAIEHYREALRINPAYADAHFGLASAWRRQGRDDAAVLHYREALKARPDWPAALLDLAWILATSRDSAPGPPAEAVQLAERGVRLNDQPTAAAFDVLAAALAAEGRFEEAVVTAQKALELAATDPDRNLGSAIRDRLEQYRQRKPFRQPKP